MTAAKTAVNLLPEEARPAPRRFPWRRLGATVLGLLAAAALAVAAWVLHAQRQAAAAAVSSLREEEARLQAELQATRDLPRVRARLEERRRFVAENRETRDAWRLLQALSEAAPQGVLLRDLSLDEGDAMVLEGTAPDLVSVAAFMRRLEGSGLFRQARVVFPEAFAASDGRQVIPFRLTVTAVRGGSAGAP